MTHWGRKRKSDGSVMGHRARGTARIGTTTTTNTNFTIRSYTNITRKTPQSPPSKSPSKRNISTEKKHIYKMRRKSSVSSY